jgi:hypothetical protein
VPPFGVPAYVDRFYAGGFLDDDSRLAACFERPALLTPLTAPIHIAYLEVTVAIDAIQHLSRTPAA